MTAQIKMKPLEKKRLRKAVDTAAAAAPSAPAAPAAPAAVEEKYYSI